MSVKNDFIRKKLKFSEVITTVITITIVNTYYPRSSVGLDISVESKRNDRHNGIRSMDLLGTEGISQ